MVKAVGHLESLQHNGPNPGRGIWTSNPVPASRPNPVGTRCHLRWLITSARSAKTARYHKIGQICLVKARPSGTLLRPGGTATGPSRRREGQPGFIAESQPDETPGRDGSNARVSRGPWKEFKALGLVMSSIPWFRPLGAGKPRTDPTFRCEELKRVWSHYSSIIPFPPSQNLPSRS